MLKWGEEGDWASAGFLQLAADQRGRRTDMTGGLSLLVPVRARTAEVSETENKFALAVFTVMP